MDLGLRGKRAVVTGGGRGIGRACALALAREGARVAICGRTLANLESTVAEMGGEAGGHFAVTLDLMDDDGPQRFVDRLAEGFGEPEIVVHNVGGTLGVRDPLAPAADWRKLWRFNVEIAIELSNAFVPAMLRRRDGRIIFISSLAALEHQGTIGYGVAKAALTAYARSLGRTYAADGIVISALVPGTIVTEGGSWDLALKRDPEGVAKYVAERMPRGRFGTPEEIGDAVAFLASERATAFIGSLIPVEGGQGRSFFGV